MDTDVLVIGAGVLPGFGRAGWEHRFARAATITRCSPVGSVGSPCSP
jgi:hypothetical protein